MRFSFPQQELGPWAVKGGDTIFVDDEANTRYANIADIDHENSHVDFVWTEKLQEANDVPAALVHDDWVNDTAKAMALQAFADDVLEGQPLNPVTMALLRGRHRGSPATDQQAGNSPKTFPRSRT